MAKKLQDLVLVSEVGSDALILMKQDEGVGLRDLQIRVSDFLNGYLTTALLGTAIGQVPQLIDNGSGTPAFPAVSGEFLTNVTDAVVVGSDLVQGKVFLSDSLVSNDGVSNGTAATPKAVKDMGALKLSLSGGALTGDVSTNSAFIYENGAVTQIRLLDTSLKTIQSYSSGTNTITVGNIDLNTEITGLDLTFTDVAGTHTVYHTGNAVTIADYEAFATTEQEFNRSREMVSEENAASGFVHFGKHHSSLESINEGLYSFPNASAVNQLFTGRDLTNFSGLSKTNFPEVNITGVITKFAGVNTPDWQYESRIKFPDAPDGTVTYDSATGAITDFTTDVDPKYGDVAGTQSEAVARAFEGAVKNGDFRNGTADWVVSGSASLSTTNGIAKITDTASSTTSQINQTITLEVGVEYVLEVVMRTGSGATGWVILEGFGNSAASQNNIVSSEWTTVTFKYTPDVSNSTSLVLREANSDGVGHYIEVSSVSVRPATNEVVTERVDHFGLEGFLEEVTNTKPYIYPNGLIQSQATTMNGITTVATNRPASYYAVFDGDTTSSGLGVHFYNLSETDKLLVLGDSNNNLFRLADGRLVQWRIRQRTIAGAGNGDWGQLDSANPAHYLRFLSTGGVLNTFVKAQGMMDTPHPDSNTYPVYVSAGRSDGNPDHIDLGTFAAISANSTPDTQAGVNGECYWLPLGTVSRLNQGAYHPSFNPMGANTFWDEGGTISSNLPWHDDRIYQPISKADCFNFQVGRVATRGYIAVGVSGRDDGRFYDAIYADGQGGVVDLRLSAQGGTISDILGTEDARTKNGTQRGLQKLVFTTVGTGTVSSSANGNFSELPTSDNPYLGFTGSVLPNVPRDTVSSTSPSRYHYVYNATDGLIYPCHALVESGGITYVAQEGSWLKEENSRLDTVNLAGKTCYMVVIEETSLSVSGEFSQTDVIGDPAQILATPDLANGWLGNWIPVIPDGTTVKYSDAVMQRKNIGNTLIAREYSDNNGTTWGQTTLTTSNTTNSPTSTGFIGVGRVEVWNYTTHAYMTEAADNPVVYKYDVGIGDSVFASENSNLDAGVLLGESVVGKVVNQSVDTHPSVDSFRLLSGRTGGNSVLPTNVNHVPTHNPIDLIQPQNGGAYKSLPLVAEENGQLFLYYLSTELVWDTTLDSLGEFSDVDPTVPNNYTAGNWYHFTSGRWSGAWLCKTSLSSATVDASDKTEVNNSILSATGNVLFEAWQGNGWGDDNLITVLDGEGTKTDLNGNTVKVSCTKVPYPLGWVRNTI